MKRHVRLFVLLAAVSLASIWLGERAETATVSRRSGRTDGSFCGSVVKAVGRSKPQSMAVGLHNFEVEPRLASGHPWGSTFYPLAAGSWTNLGLDKKDRPAPKILGLPENPGPPPLRSLLGLAATIDVGVENNFYSPDSIRVTAGDTVRWTWVGDLHSVTSGNCCTANGIFCSPGNTNCASSGPSVSGAEYSHQFNTPGTFPYYCNVHEAAMTGTVIVDAAQSSSTAQFAASTTTVTETLNATTKIDLNVSRSGDSSGAASVDYASLDGSAVERSDYLAALGTLRFAAGETSKNIRVFIVDDVYGEGPETFNVTLSNPVGLVLGSPASVTVTINSNESTNGGNPVKNATFNTDFFVREQYVDFFNREADPGGLSFWKNQIDECTTQPCREVRRVNVSAAFFVSIEFQQTGYLVYKTYQAAFNSGEFLKLREFLPDLQEIGRGVVIGQPGADAQLEANKQKFFTDFVQRSKFTEAANYPTTMPAAQFVDKLNANTLDPRNPGSGALTPGERDSLVAQLSPNPSSPALRVQVLRSVSQNPLFSNRQFNKAFVLAQYFGYLRRNPNDPPELALDFSGYNFWLNKLYDFNGNYIEAEMVKAFITSTEYELRFGP